MCLELPLAPKKIFQCSQGHVVCNTCLDKIEKKCPTCRENWVNMPNLPARNRMAENMLQKIMPNSKISKSGSLNNNGQEAKASSSNGQAVSVGESIDVPESQNSANGYQKLKLTHHLCLMM